MEMERTRRWGGLSGFHPGLVSGVSCVKQQWNVSQTESRVLSATVRRSHVFAQLGSFPSVKSRHFLSAHEV